MQDEQYRQDRTGQQRSGGGGGGGGGFATAATPIGNLPYEPRVRSNRPMNQNRDGQWEAPARNEQRTNNQGENPPGMLAMEAKVNQFAEGQSNRDSLSQPYI